MSLWTCHPRTPRRSSGPNKPFFLTIKADHTLALGDDTISLGELPAALDVATGSNKQQRIFLRADRAVPYGEVMQVLNALRTANYLKVALVGLEMRTTQ